MAWRSRYATTLFAWGQECIVFGAALISDCRNAYFRQLSTFPAGITVTKEHGCVLPPFGISRCPQLVLALAFIRKLLSIVGVFPVVAPCLWSYFNLSVAWIIALWMLVEGRAILQLILQAYSRDSRKVTRRPTLVDPDAESCPWLNGVIAKLWRESLQGFAKADGRALCNRKIRQYLGGPRGHIVNYLFSPKVMALDLGSRPPVILNIKSHSSRKRQDSIVIDLAGAWGMENANVVMALNQFLSFGLTRLSTAFAIRIKLSPILRDRFSSGRVELSVLDDPTLDFEFSGALRLLSTRPIKILIMQVFRYVASFWRFPEKVVFQSRNLNIDDHILQLSKPEGVLKIHVKEGRHLITEGLTMACRTDRYCILEVGPFREKTPVVHGSVSPTWNYKCKMPITKLDTEYGEMNIYVSDSRWCWSMDEVIGFTTVNLARVAAERKLDEWFRVLGKIHDGALHLAIELLPVSKLTPASTKPTGKRETHAILGILVHNVIMSQPCSPIVIFQVSGGKPAGTSPGGFSKNWEFAEEFLFLIQDAEKDKVTISLLDYDAQLTVRAAIKRVFDTLGNFVVDAEDSQAGKDLREIVRDEASLLAETTMDLHHFNGRRQKIQLVSAKGDVYDIVLDGCLFHVNVSSG